MGSKEKKYLWLSPATLLALEEYQRRNARRFANVSQAADHLLQRALTGGLDEGQEGLLLPELTVAVRRAVREVVGREIRERIDRQADRLAALLVTAGKDTSRAASLAAAILTAQLGEGRVAAIAEDAELRAGARYSRRSLRAGADR